MNNSKIFLRLSIIMLCTVSAVAANDPYIGFVYPAGGQQGTTFRVTFGGQFIHGVTQVLVSGAGVSVKVIEYNKKISPQLQRLLLEQRDELKYVPENRRNPAEIEMLDRLNNVLGTYVQQPACDSIANILIAEVKIEADALPGEREIRLLAAAGLTNPMPFFIGQLPEMTGAPLPTSAKAILGKEGESLLKTRGAATASGAAKKNKKNGAPEDQGMESQDMMGAGMEMGESGALSDVDDAIVRVKPPCVVNGQIGAGTVDRYLVSCRAGQELVVEVKARALVPYLADAVPGWFQPVIKLCDSSGAAVAYNDDYLFKPDPVLFYQIKRDGDYLLSIYDSIYRGREDFVYRMSIGPLPFVTSWFPLGCQLGQPAAIAVKGVNLVQDQVVPETNFNAPRLSRLSALGPGKIISNTFPLALDTILDLSEKEPNNSTGAANKLRLPVVVNGCINQPDDKDFYQFDGKAGEQVVAEVMARRLDSPLDSELMLFSPSGNCIGYNDDLDDPGSGLNTHHADSWLSVTLPEDGTYTCVISDVQHKGGSAYAYRLRLGAPRPDFDLRLVPSHVTMNSNNGSGTLTAHLIRRDGFTGPVTLHLREPKGFELQAQPFDNTQSVMQIRIKTTLPSLQEPVRLVIEGESQINGETVRREAVGAEDRMQAFLWRHLVPAQELLVWIRPKMQGNPGKGQKKSARNLAKSKQQEHKLPAGLVAHYSFDSTVDGWTPCSVDTNNNAKILNARWTQGWNKAAYALNGSNSRINIKDGPHLGTSRFSISMHIKGYKIKEENRIIFDKGSDAGYVLSILGGEDENGRNKGRLCFEIQGKRCLSEQTVADNAWYNVTLTVDEKFAKMYIDGKLQKESAIVKKAFTPVADDLIIGAHEDRSSQKKKRKKMASFEGSVDELMIYNCALSPQEVEDALYCSIPHYNQKQVQGRISDIDELLERKLISDEFHARKFKELNVEVK